MLIPGVSSPVQVVADRFGGGGVSGGVADEDWFGQVSLSLCAERSFIPQSQPRLLRS